MAGGATLSELYTLRLFTEHTNKVPTEIGFSETNLIEKRASPPGAEGGVIVAEIVARFRDFMRGMDKGDTLRPIFSSKIAL